MYLPKLCSCVNPTNEKSMYVQYFFNCGTRLETIYSEKLLRLLTFVQEKEEGGGVVVKEAAMERLIPARPASSNSCELYWSISISISLSLASCNSCQSEIFPCKASCNSCEFELVWILSNPCWLLSILRHSKGKASKKAAN